MAAWSWTEGACWPRTSAPSSPRSRRAASACGRAWPSRTGRGEAPTRSRPPPIPTGIPDPSGRAHRELLEGVTARGRQAAAHREGPGDLAHVDVPLRVHRQAMGRDEAARRHRVGRAQAREQLAGFVEDAGPSVTRHRDGPVALGGLPLVPPELGHIGAALPVEHDVSGPLGVRPFGEVFPVRVEDLDTIVLAIADEDAPVGGGRDAVGEVELAGPLAGHTP